MNDQPSPLGRNDDDRSTSPKRKKVRQKYAPKACVSCRRSKLKCSGDNPCQRCRDNDKRCFFSEDQTAAEALQNLSRPALSQQQTSTQISNGSGLVRRTVVPRHQDSGRRASDASALGLSMEARMSRIESMMDALLQERSTYTTPRAGLLHDEYDIDIAVSTSMADSVSPTLAFLGQSPRVTQPQDVIDPLLGTETANVRVANRSLVFPDPAVYQTYIHAFFRDFHCYYPCVDEQRFRSRSQSMLAGPEVHPDDVCFLALNYIMFALHAVSTEPAASGHQSKPPGWHWFQLSDEVVGKRQLVGHGDISLAQFLLFKAIYCTLIDQPSLAYNTVGLASRYTLQHGLNLEASYVGPDVWDSFERLQVFWNILIVDRYISLSCNRPYILRDLDIGVARPSHLYRRDISPLLQPSEIRDADELDEYLDFMIHWSHFAGSLWDNIFAAHVHVDTLADKVFAFEAAIDDFVANTFISIGERWPVHPGRRSQYVQMSFNNIRLMAQRAIYRSPQHEGHARAQLQVAVKSIAQARCQAWDARDSYLFRHRMVTTLAASLHQLCSALVCSQSSMDVGSTGLMLPSKADFDAAIDLLNALAQGVALAQRVLCDLDQILPVVRDALARWSEKLSSFGTTTDWSIIDDVIPPNAAELLPYSRQLPDIGFSSLRNRLWVTNGGSLETDHGVSDSDAGLEPGGAGSRVLWI